MEEWRTINEVQSNTIFSKVEVGDQVAINRFHESDWWTGKVIEIKTYSNRSTRWIERPALVVELDNAENRVSGKNGIFYEHLVREILFKD